MFDGALRVPCYLEKSMLGGFCFPISRVVFGAYTVLPYDACFSSQTDLAGDEATYPTFIGPGPSTVTFEDLDGIPD